MLAQRSIWYSQHSWAKICDKTTKTTAKSDAVARHVSIAQTTCISLQTRECRGADDSLVLKRVQIDVTELN